MLTQDYLKEALQYDKSSGLFQWKHRPEHHFKAHQYYVAWNKTYAGKPAGSKHLRYIGIRLDRKLYKAHRLAWLYEYGEFPVLYIDHINGNGFDNRLFNLREIKPGENNRNRGLDSRNRSGYNGVSWHSPTNKWVVRISYENKYLYLGCFENFLDAVEVRQNANMKYQYHPNHGLKR